MIAVIDASALVAVVGTRASEQDPRLVKRVEQLTTIHVPDLFLVETYHALRGMLIGKVISEERAEIGRTLIDQMPTVATSTFELRSRTWSLRHNFTCYDASYIALAEALDAPLITTDSKLDAPRLHSAAVEVYNVAEWRAK